MLVFVFDGLQTNANFCTVNKVFTLAIVDNHAANTPSSAHLFPNKISYVHEKNLLTPAACLGLFCPTGTFTVQWHHTRSGD